MNISLEQWLAYQYLPVVVLIISALITLLGVIYLRRRHIASLPADFSIAKESLVFFVITAVLCAFVSYALLVGNAYIANYFFPGILQGIAGVVWILVVRVRIFEFAVIDFLFYLIIIASFFTYYKSHRVGHNLRRKLNVSTWIVAALSATALLGGYYFEPINTYAGELAINTGAIQYMVKTDPCRLQLQVYQATLSGDKPDLASCYEKLKKSGLLGIIQYGRFLTENTNLPEPDTAVLQDVGTPINDLHGQKTGYSKDDRYVYFESRPIDGADPASFSLILTPTGTRTGFAKDSLHVYNKGVIEGADPATFKLLKDIQENDTGFAIDGSSTTGNVYLTTGQGAPKKLAFVDRATFSPVFYPDGSASVYARDKNHLYIQKFKNEGAPEDSLEIVPNIDPSKISFITDRWDLGTGFFTDGEQLYYENHLIAGGDPKTLIQLYPDHMNGTDYAKDKNNVYYRGQIIRGADVATFIATVDKVADKNHSYYEDKVVNDSGLPYKNLAGRTLLGKLGDYLFSKDSGHVYVADADSSDQASIIANADPNTFQILGGSGLTTGIYYAKDKRYVFVGSGDQSCDSCVKSKVISGADPKTFEIMLLEGDYAYAKDSNHAYKGGSIITGADPATFTAHAGTSKEASCGVYIAVRDANTDYLFIDRSDNAISKDDLAACLKQ